MTHPFAKLTRCALLPLMLTTLAALPAHAKRVAPTTFCTLVGSFTQGARTSEFSWELRIIERSTSYSQKLRGDMSDEYGNAVINGNCTQMNSGSKICTFAKNYTSGQSKGATFYYSGKVIDDQINGRWGYTRGNYNGGTFTAQALDCE